MTNRLTAKIHGQDSPRYYDPLLSDREVLQQVQQHIYEPVRHSLRFRIHMDLRPMTTSLLLSFETQP